ncbi:adenylate cyclase [Formivibrio citricus]|uniref:Adenylate cyclase n=1 Tax=Formivibrio citricus TaxID=83765 RepID=A0A1I5CCR4_9NEIS|nr:adenylate/guanylate cyclase domain-containing protein [Formivibrio citricus]SFN84815.1 adenylate cyclase [Formivibrio citricus]
MTSLLRKLSFFSLFLLLAGLLALDYGGLGFGKAVDQRAGDALLKLHAQHRPASSDVVVIDIDQKSLENLNEVAGNWPWPRAIHAELVEGIARQKPRAIVFDIFFNEIDTFRLDSEAAFREAVKAHPEVYLPMALLGDGLGAPLADLPAILQLEKTGRADPKARAPLLLPLVLPPETWRGGLVNFDKDSDGVGRHYLMRAEKSGWIMPSLPARLAHDFGWPPPEGRRFMLNWQSKRQHISYADLYLDFNKQQPQRPQNEFTDKIVIIGAAAPGLWDLRPTPVAKLYPGVDILATAIDNLKHGDWLEAPPRRHFAPLGIALMLLVWLGFRRRINTLWLAGGLLLVSAGMLAVQWQGLALRQFWPLAGSLAWAWGYYWLGALLAYLEEKARGAQAVAMFGRFLDARVVKDLVESGRIDPEQHAESREITVLFSDIRGFTTLSETHSPEYIVNLLNRYFTRQVEVIFRHGGTLDKFIGDAIMAFWGAPVHDPDHARHAVAAALEMAQVLEDFRREIPELGEHFDVGIGIHTGPAVVGFIGSQARLDYTVIGDTVNLASRIEGLTKGVSRILVSDSTRAASANAFEFIDHGSYTVKGREQAVALFEPQGKH